MAISQDELLGAIILCPHCDRYLKVMKIGEPIRDEETGSTGVAILLSDGYCARFWLTGPKSAD